MAKQIKHTAADRHMTLAEIEAFARDARAAGATGDEIPTVTASIGGRVKALAVDVNPARLTKTG